MGALALVACSARQSRVVRELKTVEHRDMGLLVVSEDEDHFRQIVNRYLSEASSDYKECLGVSTGHGAEIIATISDAPVAACFLLPM